MINVFYCQIAAVNAAKSVNFVLCVNCVRLLYIYNCVRLLYIYNWNFVSVFPISVVLHTVDAMACRGRNGGFRRIGLFIFSVRIGKNSFSKYVLLQCQPVFDVCEVYYLLGITDQATKTLETFGRPVVGGPFQLISSTGHLVCI